MELLQIAEMKEDKIRAYLERLRWPKGPVCPRKGCGSSDVVRVGGTSGRPGLLRCRSCRRQFTVTVGTIFEDSHIPLKKWVMAFHLLCSAKKGVSALQLQRELSLGSYKTAWFMAHRIRYAMGQDPLKGMLKGTIEIDETFVGGKVHRKRGMKMRDKKTPVMALIERGGRMKTRVVATVSPENLSAAINDLVDPSATMYTDGWQPYRSIAKARGQKHEWVDHAHFEYSRNGINVNSAECFFSLLKRGVMGAFHHVSKEHLGRYAEEFAFRWDTRKVDDGTRRDIALRKTEGCRLHYRQPVSGLVRTTKKG